MTSRFKNRTLNTCGVVAFGRLMCVFSRTTVGACLLLAGVAGCTDGSVHLLPSGLHGAGGTAEILDAHFLDCRLSPFCYMDSRVRCRGRLVVQEDDTLWLAPLQQDMPPSLFLSPEVGLFFGPASKKLLIRIDMDGQERFVSGTVVSVEGILGQAGSHVVPEPPNVLISDARVAVLDRAELGGRGGVGQKGNPVQKGHAQIAYESPCPLEFWLVVKGVCGEERHLIHCSGRLWILAIRRDAEGIQAERLIEETLAIDPRLRRENDASAILSWICTWVSRKAPRSSPALEDGWCLARHFTDLEPLVVSEDEEEEAGRQVRVLFDLMQW